MTPAHLRWATEPMHAKLFIFYLLIVYFLAVVYSVRLVWALAPLGARLALRNVARGDVTEEILARAALANRVLIEPIGVGGLESNGTLTPSHEKPTLYTLRAVDSRFKDVVGRCQADAAVIKRLSWLTLLVSFLVVVYGAFPTLADQFNDRNVIGSAAILATVDLLLSRLALGLASCAVLYAVSSVSEVTLMRRLNTWQHLHSQVVLFWSTHHADPTRSVE